MIRPKLFPIILAALFNAGCSQLAPLNTRGTMVREVTDTRLHSYLQEAMKRERFTGAALVMRKGEILHAKGYDWTTDHTANGVDTKFHVGSITKQFTAAAIMQLVEKGVVKLDSSINAYLPDKYKSPRWSVVTVHHLLSHTSGITDYAVARDYYDVIKGFCLGDTVDGMVKEAMSKDLEFVPGSRFSYTNLGYTLLGFIIENQTHRTYDEYIEHNILAPMGMNSSRIHTAGHVPAEDEAEGFRWSEEKGRHVPDDVLALPATAPDGGLITTLGDFAKWTRIYTTEKQTVLSRESIALMSRPIIGIGAGGPLNFMGYGLYVGDRFIGHGGLIVGFSSQFIVDRETQSVIVVFSNDAGTNPQRIAFGLLTILLTPSS